MIQKRFLPLAILLVACWALSPSAFAKKPEGKGMKSSYMVTMPHTKEECLAALDAMADNAPKLLAKTKYGCGAGDHTGYAMVEGKSDAEVKNMIPESLQSNAKIQKVETYTTAQIKQFHKH